MCGVEKNNLIFYVYKSPKIRTYNNTLFTCLWGRIFVYFNMKEQPKITRLTDRRDDTDSIKNLKGITSLSYKELSIKFGLNPNDRDFEKRFNTLGGIVKSLNRQIDNRRDKIDNLETEIQDIQTRLMKQLDTWKTIISYIKPRVVLKKPTKSYPYWKGRVWFNIGGNTLYRKNMSKGDTEKVNTKGRNIELHLCSEKYRQDNNLTDDDLREMGVRKFRQHILKEDFYKYLPR